MSPIVGTFSSGGGFGRKGGKPPVLGLYEFTNATFTPGGKTGDVGPSLTEIRNGLTGTGVDVWKNDTANVNVSSGIVSWRVPATASYIFELGGGQGGAATTSGRAGGLGARFTTNAVPLTEGNIIRIQIGQRGNGSADGNGAGGGGGTSIYNSSTSTLIAIAGGGGGGGLSNNGRNAENTSNGGGGIHGSPGAIISNGGSGGNGGNNTVDAGASGTCAWSAAGWAGNGPATSQCGRSGGSAAQQLSGSATGGLGEGGNGAGGFGGGGGGANSNGYGGGGGGYSGGGSGGFPGGGGGGFGGSFSNNGINSFTTNSSAPGFVTITKVQ